MDIILNGIVSGIVLALLIGPVFFAIVQTSIERGFWNGALVATGASLSDIVYITISYLGLTHIVETESFRQYLAYGGGVVLLLFGLYYLLIKRKQLLQFDPEKMQSRSWFRLVGKGFIINGLSPMVLFFWIATVSVATTQLGYTSTRQVVTFFTAVVATVFSTDLLKAKLADKLRQLVTVRSIRIMNIVLGVLLIIFAGRLIFFPENIPH